MSKKHIVTNIVGSTSRSDLAKLGQSYTLNMYEETTNSNENYVSKVLRPIKGYENVVNISGTCRGIFTVSHGYKNNPITYTVFDDTLYLITEGSNTPYKIGNISYGNTPVHFAETGNRSAANGLEESHSHLVIVDGQNCYAVDTQVLPALQKQDFCVIQLPYTDFEHGTTVNPTHIAYLYGYLVINDKNSDNFYISYQFPFEITEERPTLDKNIWQVNNGTWLYGGQSEQAYWAPDNTTALVANGSRLYTFGDRSYQMFQYTNDLNTPFNSPDTAAYPIGLKAVNTLCQLGSTVVWLGAADIGNNGIYVLQGGTQATRVSTPEIEREISKFKTVKDAKAQIWQDNQHIFYCITFPTANVTYCYDLTEQSWSNRCSLNSSNEKIAWRYNFATMNADGEILQSHETGIAKQVENKWNEHDDNPILRLRRGGIIVSDYSPFYIDSIEVLTNNGQYEHFINEPAQMMMRFSSDGSSWSDNETVELGFVGNYNYDCVFYNFGMAREFTLELSCSDNIPFALYALNIGFDPIAY